MAKSSSFYNFKKTNALLKKAERYDAWAANRRRGYSQIEGKYPFYATHAKGAYVWDVDGNRYIDYMLGYGTIILGHADKRITKAVTDELEKGNNVSPVWKPNQVELTKLLTEVIPGAEMAFLMKSGSDATSVAVRLSRAFTGRNKVVRWGYNGWHDWATPLSNGVPDVVKEDVLMFEYNNIDSLKSIFNKYPKEIACVIMMSFELEKPTSGFLEQVKILAHKHGALFILDEMRSGFRIALGGAQEYFNVKADLATFSKAMSNGHPISALVGRSDVLSYVGKTKVTSTFFGSSAEMAAAISTIKILRDTNVLSKIWKLGEYFQEGIEELIANRQAPAEFIGFPPFPFIRFAVPDEEINEKVKRAFFVETAKRGIFLHPNHQWYISAAHTKKDIDYTLEVFDLAFAVAEKELIKNEK